MPHISLINKSVQIKVKQVNKYSKINDLNIKLFQNAKQSYFTHLKCMQLVSKYRRLNSSILVKNSQSKLKKKINKAFNCN